MEEEWRRTNERTNENLVDGVEEEAGVEGARRRGVTRPSESDPPLSK